jgi:uncharacterized protein with GYD domain
MMARYLSFARYSASAVYRDRLVNRRKFLEEYIRGLTGGQVLEVFAAADDEWDIVVMIEAPDDYGTAKQVAHGLLTHGTGGTERQKI